MKQLEPLQVIEMMRICHKWVDEISIKLKEFQSEVNFKNNSEIVLENQFKSVLKYQEFLLSMVSDDENEEEENSKYEENERIGNEMKSKPGKQQKEIGVLSIKI